MIAIIAIISSMGNYSMGVSIHPLQKLGLEILAMTKTTPNIMRIVIISLFLMMRI